LFSTLKVYFISKFLSNEGKEEGALKGRETRFTSIHAWNKLGQAHELKQNEKEPLKEMPEKKSPIQILLVEDNRNDTVLIQRAFALEDPSISIDCAENLKEARDILAKSSPDLVLLDYFLPDGKGLELFAIREKRPLFPALIMTSQGHEALAVEAMKAGALDYIVKSNAAFLSLPKTCQRVLREWHQMEEKRKAEDALRASEERFQAIFKHSPEAIFVICPGENQVVEANPSACKMLGYTRAELLFKPLTEIHVDQGDQLQAFVRLVSEKGHACSEAFTARTKKGSDIPVEISASEISIDGKRCILATKRDISERKQAEKNERLSGLIFKNAAEAIVVTDPEGVILLVNEAFSRITGYSAQEAIGKNPSMLRSGKHNKAFYQKMWAEMRSSGYWTGEIWNRKKCGTLYPEFLSIAPVKDEQGEITQYIGLFSDISKLKAGEAQLHHQAHYDALTGLPNRVLLNEHLSQVLKQTRRNKTKAALLFLDLDRFKQVNDTLGHPAGDQVLKLASERLLKAVRESDTVARSGGDEFILLLPGIEERKEAGTVARKIIRALSRPFEIEGHHVFLGASIGITILPEDGEISRKLFRNADMAMYKAKESGRNKFHYFSAKMEQAVEKRTHIEWDLRKAVEGREFVLYYQTLVDLQSFKTIGLEALIKWNYPRKGLVAPKHFIPLAEESDLINQIGKWVLITACKCFKDWQNRYAFEGVLHVNVSSRQILYGDFQTVLMEALEESGIAPGTLILEVTESLMLDPTEDPISKLKALKSSGVQLAMDDFGTGYSSLSYLARYPIDILKIDQSFISNIASDPQKQSLVEAIIRMGQSMKMKIIAEGIETEEDLSYLLDSGCDIAQGYYFSHPRSWKAYDAILEKEAHKGGLL